MHQINLHTVCEWYHSVQELAHLSDRMAPQDEIQIAWAAEIALLSFVDDKRFAFPKTGAMCKFFYSLVHTLRFTHNRDWKPEGQKLYSLAASRASILERLEEFNKQFSVEMPGIHCYLLPQEGPYSIDALLEADQHTFDAKTSQKLPANALTDIREAGRCLALDSFTACGFHILRAAESVITVYMGHVNHPAVYIKNRNWGTYIRVLQNEPISNKKIVKHIQDVKDYYRNPLMHPEQTLNRIEARGLFGVCQTLIQSIADELPVPPAPAPPPP